MNGYDELYEDDLDSIEDIGDYESDDELSAFLAEDDEARRRRRRPVKTGKGANYYKARPASRYVTQVQLQAALSKISNDVKANAVGIKTVGGRVDTLSTEQKKHTEVLKREVAQRKREIAKIKSNLQLSAILPLIMSKSLTLPANSISQGVPATETRVSVAPSGFTALLPALMGGDGFGGTGGGGESGGDSSGMLLFALAAGGGL